MIYAKVGSFIVPAGGSPAHQDVGFPVKALVCFWTIRDEVGTASPNDQGSVGHGMTDGTAQYCQFGSVLEWPNATRASRAVMFDKTLWTHFRTSSGLTHDSAGTIAFSSNGFDVTMTDPPSTGNDYRVGYWAIGGDFQRKQLGPITLSSGTTPQSYTGFGFAPQSFLVMHSDGGPVTFAETTAGQHMTLGYACKDLPTGIRQSCVSGIQHITAEGTGQPGSAFYFQSDGGAIRGRAVVSSFDADGFSITKPSSLAADFGAAVLAFDSVPLFGTNLSYNGEASDTVGLIQVMSDPIAVLAVSADTQHHDGNSRASGGWSTGASDGTTERLAWGYGAGNIPTTSDDRQEDALCYLGPGYAIASISSWSTSGYTVSYTPLDSLVDRDLLSIVIAERPFFTPAQAVFV